MEEMQEGDILFIPYAGDAPALVKVNGHKLLIVSTDSTHMKNGLPTIGADGVIQMDVEGDSDLFLSYIANQVGCEVVIAPTERSLDNLLETLKAQLPWVH